MTDGVDLTRRLSLLIGMITEDEVDGAIMSKAADAIDTRSRIAEPASAASDLGKLAAAAEVVLRRSNLKS